MIDSIPWVGLRSVGRMDIRRGLTIGAVLTVGIALTGCTGAPTDAGTPAPSASASPAPTPTPTPTADADTDAALLPIPVDDIKDWADTAITWADDAQGTGTFSGWLSEHTSAHHLTSFSSVPAGTYQGQIACRGDGTITLQAGELDSDPSTEPIECTNATIAFDLTTTGTGMSVTLDLDGAPTIYAVALQRVE